MEYLAFASQLELGHWLIVAGAVLVIIGVIGIIVGRVRSAWLMMQEEDVAAQTERTDPKMNIPGQDGGDAAP